MLGRWQPWHKEHTELFKKALSKTGQICIMLSLAEQDDSNPFDPLTVTNNIKKVLLNEGYTFNKQYTIIVVPNIIDIS